MFVVTVLSMNRFNECRNRQTAWFKKYIKIYQFKNYSGIERFECVQANRQGIFNKRMVLEMERVRPFHFGFDW